MSSSVAAGRKTEISFSFWKAPAFFCLTEAISGHSLSSVTSVTLESALAPS